MLACTTEIWPRYGQDMAPPKNSQNMAKIWPRYGQGYSMRFNCLIIHLLQTKKGVHCTP